MLIEDYNSFEHIRQMSNYGGQETLNIGPEILRGMK